MEIIWSPEASTSYEKTILDILDKWPIETVEKFEKEVNKLLDRLSQNKKLCPPSDQDPLLRKCVISKQTSLIYEINQNSIGLIVFVDNRSNHNY